MKSNIDNKNPRQATFLRTKAKKNALMEERIDQIENENRLLLRNIMRVRIVTFVYYMVHMQEFMFIDQLSVRAVLIM